MVTLKLSARMNSGIIDWTDPDVDIYDGRGVRCATESPAGVAPVTMIARGAVLKAQWRSPQR